MANSFTLSVVTLSLLVCVAPPHPSWAQDLNAMVLPPTFAFGWQAGKSSFRAGDTAVITIMTFNVPDANVSSVRRFGSFKITVCGKSGNSSCLTDIVSHLEGDLPSWTLSLVPILSGDFTLMVEEERFAIGVSTLGYTVAARDVHPSASLASWMFAGAGYVVAGSRAFVSVIPRDAFGNNVPPGTDMPSGDAGYFRPSGSYVNGTAVELLDLQYYGWMEDGRFGFEFVSTVAGDLLVHVSGGGRTLRDSPLLLKVKPGPIDIAKSTADWKHGTNVLQIFSKLEIFINQKDQYGNLVPEIHPFDAAVVEKGSKLSVPIGDLRIEPVVAEGIQMLSFNVGELGEFVLTIFDVLLKQKVSNTEYQYNVFVGYCDGSNSFANGSGIAQSVAGSVSSFMVYLEDQYRDPSPVETAMLLVQILGKNGTSVVNPIITPVREPNETISMDGPNPSDYGPAEHQKMVAGNSTLQASHFNVSYTPEIAGEHVIWVLCGNIVLNNGNPYAMTVSPGAVSTTISIDPQFEPRVKRLVTNEVTVRLRDSFMNPVLALEAKLKIQLMSATLKAMVHTSSFVAEEFVNNKDGSYTAHYVAMYVGSYRLCTLIGNRQLPPFPIEVQVIEDDYFSDVQNDNISVWEDTRNRNGIAQAELHIFVEPINDPPVILAPKSIFLGGKESREGYQIFDKQRDPFEFSIVEPDLRRYPGNKSYFELVLSLEVLEGSLVMTLPSGIVPTAELKTDGGNHWQSLETYVAIAHHFVVRGSGIRFRGDVSDCNNAMQRLFYQGASHETSLFITVNDLGNHGCYPDCSEMTSRPLSTAKTVRLVKTRPMNMNSRRAILVIGSAIATEILAMLCLGGVLLCYLVKCMCGLRGRRRGGERIVNDDDVHTPYQSPSDEMSSSASDDGGNRSSVQRRSYRSLEQQELELQPLSGIRNSVVNQDPQPAVDKDK
uniref:Uncharacterized protein n=1 Tax=Avena sativa TaxID=4498 RepID=A0ACD5YG55_AVESA